MVNNIDPVATHCNFIKVGMLMGPALQREGGRTRNWVFWQLGVQSVSFQSMIGLEDSFGGEEENAVDEDNEEDEDDLAIKVSCLKSEKK